MSDMRATPGGLQSPAPVYKPPSTSPDLLRALKALRALLRDKDNTTQVFEIMRALNGRSNIAGYRRLLRSPQGGRIAYEREELIEHLDDDAAMAAYPPGSVGAAYLAWRTAEGLSAAALAEESRKGLDLSKLDMRHPYAWYGRRIRDTHDLWHILTGYGRDALGEACLVAFSFAQTRGLGWGLIAVGASLNSHRVGGGPRHVAAIWQGFRQGRRAAWLPGEDFRALLSEPVEAARARLGVLPPTLYDAISLDRRNPIRR